MKKWLTTFICGLGIQTILFAQGNVDWGGIIGGFVSAQTNNYGFSGDIQGSASLGTGYYFELLIGSVWNGSAEAPPTTLVQFAAWTDSGLEASNSPNPGRIIVMNPNLSATVNALSTTVSNNIVLVGWSANWGSTWSSAYANMRNELFLSSLAGPAYLGTTAVGYIEGFASGSVGATIFGSSVTSQGLPIYSPNTQLYNILVPEPDTVTLIVLGITLLPFYIFKRRRTSTSPASKTCG